MSKKSYLSNTIYLFNTKCTTYDHLKAKQMHQCGENTTWLCHDASKLQNRSFANISGLRPCQITEFLTNTQLCFCDNTTGPALNWPEFEFGQSSDERAELLVLLGGEGWTLICKRWEGRRRREGGGSGWITGCCKFKSTTRLLCNLKKKPQSDSAERRRTFIKQWRIHFWW